MLRQLPRYLYRYGEQCSPYLLLIITVFIISACQQQSVDPSQVISGSMMGTQYRITIVSNKPTNSELEKGVVKAMEAVNQSMSTYIIDSELNQFNRVDAQKEVHLSDDLATVITESLEISKLTNGAFDITVAPLVNYWGFGPVKNQVTPDAGLIKQMRKYVGYQHLTLKKNKLSKNDERVQLDLSAIAKGYAVDQVAEYLNNQGISNFLINIGGELKAHGRNPEGDLWRVAVEKPQLLGGVQQVVELDNVSIATSGDYRNYVEVDGVKYSHTIDPSLFAPKQDKLASVSVIHQNASTADALATALLVMGEKQAFIFAEQHQIAAFFIVRSEKMDSDLLVDVRFSREFAPYLTQ